MSDGFSDEQHQKTSTKGFGAQVHVPYFPTFCLAFHRKYLLTFRQSFISSDMSCATPSDILSGIGTDILSVISWEPHAKAKPPCAKAAQKLCDKGPSRNRAKEAGKGFKWKNTTALKHSCARA